LLLLLQVVVGFYILLSQEEFDISTIAFLVLQVLDKSCIEKHKSALVLGIASHKQIFLVSTQPESAHLWIRLQLQVGVKESGGEL